MPHHFSLGHMAVLVRERAISPVELVEAHLRQIEKQNPALNAFVVILADQAREDARRAEQKAGRVEPLGPLHGVPVTVKDSFDVAGLPTLCGSRLRLDHRAAADSSVVARLRAAGAILLGKTNCAEFLNHYETDNYVTGRTNNPWNLEHTAGGSSGGEAAAIAAFCSAGGVGSDGGGSIRIPAAFCGIAGLKPTPGRISAAGHFPLIGHPGGLLGVAGPMARTAEDLRLLFLALAGYDSQDPFSAPVPPQAPDLTGLRVGVAEQFGRVPASDAARLAVRRAARALADLRIPAEDFQPAGLERAPELWWLFFERLPAPLTARLLAGREQDAHWTCTELLQLALREPAPTTVEVMTAFAIRDRMRAGLLRQMEDYRVLLMPACGVPAFPHRSREWAVEGGKIGLLQAMAPATPFNLLGLPALVIPFGHSPDGLPVAVQLVGRPYEEELLLELAIRLEEVRGPFPGPPAQP
jgi:Asp-tRNA(Asn)/Glu-tRNA(Gln) amidotransferase A subunit family amidase